MVYVRAKVRCICTTVLHYPHLFFEKKLKKTKKHKKEKKLKKKKKKFVAENDEKQRIIVIRVGFGGNPRCCVCAQLDSGFEIFENTKMVKI